jgi:Arc/MetJ-type ribon-helix-helix transcriptional regulator
MIELNIEITAAMKEYADRKIATGAFKTTTEVVHSLFNVAMLAERKAEIDRKLLEALDQIERGEFSPWEPGEGQRILDDVIRRHREAHA